LNAIFRGSDDISFYKDMSEDIYTSSLLSTKLSYKFKLTTNKLLTMKYVF